MRGVQLPEDENIKFRYCGIVNELFRSVKTPADKTRSVVSGGWELQQVKGMHLRF